MDSLTKLKPCPFCGGNAHLHIHNRFGVECDECGMGLACIKLTAKEAIEAWNKRVNDINLEEDLSDGALD